jgi:transposase
VADKIEIMTEAQTNTTGTGGPDLDQSELAHSIIESLLDHTRVVSDLIALMAQALDQDTTKALTLTPQWQAYLESRRKLEQTREEVEKFARIVSNLSANDDNPSRRTPN